MSMAQYPPVPFKMPFSALLSVANGVFGCWWTISARAVLVSNAFWQFSNNPPNSDYVADTIT